MGGLAQRLDKFHKNPIDIRQHVIVPESHDTIVTLCKPFIACAIIFGSNAVLAAIDLDDQPRFKTSEVSDKGPNGNLTPESMIFELAIANSLP